MLAKHILTNEELRKASGSFNSKDKLTSFLYELMRDHLPAGQVQEIINNLAMDKKDLEFAYSNGWLAKYAECLANELKTPNT